MDALWVFLIASALLLVYTTVLVRAAIRRKQWAIDTLKATACLVEGPSAPAWLMLEQAEQLEPDSDSELVA